MSSDLFAPLPEPPGDPFASGRDGRARALGVVALIVSVVAVVVSVGAVAVAGHPVGAAAGRAFAEAPVGEGVDPTWLTPVGGWLIAAAAAFWTGTVLGCWGLIQGLVAVSAGRGRGVGIAAAVIAVAGPALFLAAGGMTLLAGYTTAAAVPVG